ncbi:MAG: hypothetical protein KJ698_14040 [Actinobacteria bacterium]|nr:hypothetical protein [Actinomycetota bacterium]
MTASVEKVAVSVDREVLLRLERMRRTTGETRSALVVRALRRLLADEEQRARVAEYVAAYRSTPEAVAEVELARSLAVRSLASIPWDEE